MRALVLGALALSLAACAKSSKVDGPNIFLLPANSGEVTSTTAPVRSSVLDATPTLLRFQEGTLQLNQVIASLERQYPLLTAFEKQQIAARSAAFAARGAYDLRLKSKGKWQVEGFFRNHSVDTFLEQQTGLWGTTFFTGYRLGVGDFDLTFDGKRRVNHGGEFRGGFRTPLLQGGAIDKARKGLMSADLEVQLTEQELNSIQVKLTGEATIAYWEWVAAGRNLQIAEQLLNLAEARQKGIEGRVRRGELPEIEKVDNERLVVRRRGTRIEAQRAFEQASLRLSLFLRDETGRPQLADRSLLPTTFPEPKELPAPQFAADLERALRFHPDLRKLRVKATKAGLEERFQDNRTLPKLDFFFLASEDLDETRPSKTKGGFELTLGFEFFFPIQNRDAKGRRAAARADIERLRALIQLTQDQIRADLENNASALRNGVRQLVQARRARVLAQRLAQAEQRLFDLGQSDILRLNIRESSAAKAAAVEIKVLAKYWASRAKYRVKQGLAFGEAIKN